MASTGIILRRLDYKHNFVGDKSLTDGELVFSLNDNEFGFLKDGDDTGTVTWGRLENELPEGGITGQILAKSLNNNYMVEWIDAPESGSNNIVVQGANQPNIENDYAVKIPWDFSKESNLCGSFVWGGNSSYISDRENGNYAHTVDFNIPIATDFQERNTDNYTYDNFPMFGVPILYVSYLYDNGSGSTDTDTAGLSVVRIGNDLYIMIDNIEIGYNVAFQPPYELRYTVEETTFVTVWSDYTLIS